VRDADGSERAEHGSERLARLLLGLYGRESLRRGWQRGTGKASERRLGVQLMIPETGIATGSPPINGAGIADLGTKSPKSFAADQKEEDLRITEPAAEDEPLPQVEDSILLMAMQQQYEKSKTARETRARLNRRNWDALHGKFDFLAKKRPGQSQIVIP